MTARNRDTQRVMERVGGVSDKVIKRVRQREGEGGETGREG